MTSFANNLFHFDKINFKTQFLSAWRLERIYAFHKETRAFRAGSMLTITIMFTDGTQAQINILLVP
jgi:hypothetical protein